ncbi:MAG TPA: ATP-binding protein [Myxococcales bacterium]|nr:ATP-binding protein [Myxococcales bacterium]
MTWRPEYCARGRERHLLFGLQRHVHCKLAVVDEAFKRTERAQNLWTSFLRSVDPMAQGAKLTANPEFTFDSIGGLAGAKEEILTYACAATNPSFYSDWGTFPPSGVLLIGADGVGKSLLARALATHTETSFLEVEIPRLVLDVVHAGGKVGDLVSQWSGILEEMPPLTVYFDELEFSRAQAIGTQRPDLPVGPIMDFLLEIVDRTIANKQHLVIGATSTPDTLRPAFVAANRFERLVEVNPQFPEDMIAAVQIHADAAEKRAGHRLFSEIDWTAVLGNTRDCSPGDWVRILHAVLRHKASEAARGEATTQVNTQDLKNEVERFKHAQRRVRTAEGGNYV